MGGKIDVAPRGDHALKRVAGHAVSAGAQGRLMALVAVQAAGEAAVVVAA